MMKISPSILNADLQNLQEEVNSLLSADRIHLDIMDGLYVENTSFTDSLLDKIQFPKPTEAHLMVDHPETFFERFVQLGVMNISFHIENTGEKALKLLRLLQTKHHIKAGIVVDGYSDTNLLTDEVLQTADQVLIMSVKAGKGGQSFMPESIEKIKQIRSRGFLGEIEVDGGVTLQNVQSLKDAGADIVVVGNFLMKNPQNNRQNIITKFQEI